MKENGKMKGITIVGSMLVVMFLALLPMVPSASAYDDFVTAPFPATAWTGYGLLTQSGSGSYTLASPTMSASTGSGTMGIVLDRNPVSSSIKAYELIAMSGCNFVPGQDSQTVTIHWYVTAGGTYYALSGKVDVAIYVYAHLFDVTTSTSLSEVGKTVMHLSKTNPGTTNTYGGPWSFDYVNTWRNLNPTDTYLVVNELELVAQCDNSAGSYYARSWCKTLMTRTLSS
jgi:hypothetical protein